MITGIRYVHTNLIARDWRCLVDFYVQCLGCVIVPPERDLKGPALEAGTGVAGATLRGVHVRLPGLGSNGPTLEIFSYGDMPAKPPTAIQRPGFGHLAFQVDDVEAARAAVLAAGGRALGEVVRLSIGADRIVTWCYVTDPEDNPIEFQSWSTLQSAEVG